MNTHKCLIIGIQVLMIFSLDAAPFVYVVNFNDSSFSVIDQATGAPITGSPFMVPNNAGLISVAISSDNQTAYMIDENNSTLIAIDTATNNIVSTTSLNINPLQQPSAITINGTMAYVGVASFGIEPTGLLPVNITNRSAPIPGTIIQIDGSHPFQTNINDIVISNNIAYVLVVDGNGSQTCYIAAVDLSSLVVTKIPLANGSIPIGIAINTNTNIAYVTLLNLNKVQAFQLPAVTPIGAPISVGTSPAGIVISSDNHYAYVANEGDGTVSVIDLTLSTPSVVATIMDVPNQSNGAENIVISTDNTRLYVATGVSGNDTVTPITVATRTAGTQIPVGGAAYALAVTSSGSAGPTNVVGVRTNNVFLLQTARYVTITWTASTSPMVTSYNIYNGTALIGTVPATSPLTFNAFIPVGDDGNNLFVSAVSTLGGESALTPVVV